MKALEFLKIIQVIWVLLSGSGFLLSSTWVLNSRARQRTTEHTRAHQCTPEHAIARQNTPVHATALEFLKIIQVIWVLLSGSGFLLSSTWDLHRRACQITPEHARARQCTPVHANLHQSTPVHARARQLRQSTTVYAGARQCTPEQARVRQSTPEHASARLSMVEHSREQLSTWNCYNIYFNC
jgi:hypothetical protein